VLEPLDTGSRLQHLMGETPLALAIVPGGREPRGLDRKAALRT
jgi:hypothetical protein